MTLTEVEQAKEEERGWAPRERTCLIMSRRESKKVKGLIEQAGFQ